MYIHIEIYIYIYTYKYIYIYRFTYVYIEVFIYSDTGRPLVGGRPTPAGGGWLATQGAAALPQRNPYILFLSISQLLGGTIALS